MSSASRPLRPAFVVTTTLVLAACSEPSGKTQTAPDDGVTETRNPPQPEPEATAATPKLPLTDARGHSIFRKADGSCYVQVPKKGEPPKDLMSGERWVENEAVACPKEFQDPAFAAVPDGSVLGQDDKGKCYVAQTYGNPPPPPQEAPCPQFLKKP